MIHKISVDNLVKCTVAVKEFDVCLKLFTLMERCLQSIKHSFFFFGQLIRICRVDSREIGISQREYSISQLNSSRFIIYLIKQKSVFHTVFRMSHDPLPFHLELTDSDSLVHLSRQLIIYRVKLIFIESLRLEEFTWVIGIYFRCHSCQRSQVDSIAYFKHIKVVIAYIHSQNVGYACPVSCSCTHPYDVMVTPLDINIVVLHEEVHYVVRMRTSVPHISYDMKSVYGQ